MNIFVKQEVKASEVEDWLDMGEEREIFQGWYTGFHIRQLSGESPGKECIWFQGDRNCQTQFGAHWGRDAYRMPEVDTQYVENNMALELSIKVGLSHQHLDANWSHGNEGDHPVYRGRDKIQCWDIAAYWKLRSGRKTRKGWCLWSEGEYIF